MAVWSQTKLSNVRRSFGRIDAEFYRPESLDAFSKVTAKSHDTLGHLVNSGYRVVYENTKILNSSRIKDTSVRFLQATNVGKEGLSMDIDSIGYVNENDWIRYPKGRIQPGELLIEVKGQAEKVTVVPDIFPVKTLVSGSLFKVTVNSDRISQWYLFLFLSTRYGKLLRDRLKTNTLIGFVSKPQLYSIPVFIPNSEEQEQFSIETREAFKLNMLSQDLYSKAQNLLESELGLEKLKFKKPVSYTAQFSDLEISHRSDAQHFQPRFKQLTDHLLNFPTARIRDIRIYNRRGLQPIYVENGKLDVINSQHLGPKHIDYEGLQKTSATAFSAAPEAHIQQDDLLIYTTGAYIGRTNVYLSNAPAMASNHVNILRLRPNIDAAYMALVFQSTVGQFQTQKHARGSAQAELYPTDIDRFLVPLLDIGIQKAIGDLLRESLMKQHESRKLLEHAKARVEQLIEEAAQT